MRIVVAGIIGRFPWGGVTWCSLMYLLGLRSLGHDVYYLEDTLECNFDPELNALSEDPAYAVRYVHEALEPFGFGDRWCYVDYRHEYHGMSRARLKEVCRDADLLVVLSGGVWIWRDEYANIPRKVFIDSDPAFTQLAIHNARENSADNETSARYVKFFKTYDKLFTFGQNIGTPRCDVPVNGMQWLPTTQPICTELWKPSHLPPRSRWTTIMTWQIDSFTDVGGNKDREFTKIMGLSNRLLDTGGPALELAVSGPRDMLKDNGWHCIDPQIISADLWRYHNYISSSRGEFSVAKHTYVASRCGWFSDRTACYLATGRPAVVQETGLSDWLPTGDGLLTWTTEDEAFEQLHKVKRNYSHHSAAARDIAVEHLSAGKVLTEFLSRCNDG